MAKEHSGIKNKGSSTDKTGPSGRKKIERIIFVLACIGLTVFAVHVVFGPADTTGKSSSNANKIAGRIGKPKANSQGQTRAPADDSKRDVGRDPLAELKRIQAINERNRSLMRGGQPGIPQQPGTLRPPGRPRQPAMPGVNPPTPPGYHPPQPPLPR